MAALSALSASARRSLQPSPEELVAGISTSSSGRCAAHGAFEISWIHRRYPQRHPQRLGQMVGGEGQGTVNSRRRPQVSLRRHRYR
jgi:hypothetical protein